MEILEECTSFDTERGCAIEAFHTTDPEGSPWVELLRLARLTAHLFGTKGAAVGLIGPNGNWQYLSHGLVPEDDRSLIRLCHATMASQDPLIISDTKDDTRFLPARDKAELGFFAGTQIRDASGRCIGMLSVFGGSGRQHRCDTEVALLEEITALASKLVSDCQDERLSEIATKLVRASPEAVVAADRQRKMVYLNPAAEKMFGYSSSQALGRDVSTLVPQKLNPRQEQIYRKVADGERDSARLIGSFVEFEARHADGHTFPVEVSFARWGSETDGGVAAVIRDNSELKELERDRERMSSFLETVIQNLPAMLFVKDTKTQKYLLVNHKAEALVGRTAESMLGRTDSELFPGLGEAYQERDAIAAAGWEQTVFESEFTRDDGEKRNIRTTRIVIDGPDRPRQFLLGLSEDTTEIRQVEEQNRWLAQYDSLTGLLNRASFFEQIKKLIAVKRSFALFSIDLDRFKSINDQFGHPVGDGVLKEIAERIKSSLEGADIAARIGGDEFVVILEGPSVRQRAAKFGEDLLRCVAEPIFFAGRKLSVGVSAGIVIHPEDAENLNDLREYCDIALYRAKEQGRGKICFFDRAMIDELRKYQKLESAFLTALEGEDIYLKYQPIVCASTGRLASLEALARWDLECHGAIPPNVFIPLAEDCGLIDELGRQILLRACADARYWKSDLSVSVNLSPLQFRSGNLVRNVRQALKTSGLAPSRLHLEVTERLVIDEDVRAFETFEALHALGIKILLDDFGVGHSALSYFQRFPFDKVKIDKSFTNEIESSHAAKSIVKAIVSLADNLAMEVVAEGVETAKQREMLTQLGCSHLQGYLFSEPLDAGLISSLTEQF